eukprot:4844369-Alexandrium_andersonii.AAC.1
MSASLVGSEMCIRDRPGKAADMSVLLKAPPADEESGFPRGYTAPGAAAVSYTHLTLPTICSV